jgi:hypothetical protein
LYSIRQSSTSTASRSVVNASTASSSPRSRLPNLST